MLVENNFVSLNLFQNFTRDDKYSWLLSKFVLNYFLVNYNYVSYLRSSKYFERFVDEWIDGQMDLEYVRFIQNRLFRSYSLCHANLYANFNFDSKFLCSFFKSHENKFKQSRLEFCDQNESDDEDIDEMAESQRDQQAARVAYRRMTYFPEQNFSMDLPANKIPIHFYSALAKCGHDFEGLLSENNRLKDQLNNYLEIICSKDSEIELDVLMCALWSVASAGVSEKGLRWLNEKINEKYDADLIEIYRNVLNEHASLIIRGHLELNSGVNVQNSDGPTRVVVRLMVLSDRVNSEYASPITNPPVGFLSQLIDYGTGQNIIDGMIGGATNLRSMYLPINRDAAIVHYDKLVYLNAPRVYNNTALQLTGFDYENTIKMFKIKIPCNKQLKYTDSTNYPTNFAPYICATFFQMNGGANTTAYVKLHHVVEFKYEDI